MKLIIILFAFIFAFSVTSCKKSDEPKNKVTETKTTEVKKETQSSAGSLFKMESVEPSKEKNTAPNFSWKENDKKVSLADFKGKVVFLNFWATWCGPCKREMPDLSKISEEFKDKNFKMFGLNVFQQEGSPKIEDFVKSNPVSYPIIDGNDDLVKAFASASGNDMQAVPTTFILDKEGKIVETIVGGRDKETFVKLINKYLN